MLQRVKGATGHEPPLDAKATAHIAFLRCDAEQMRGSLRTNAHDRKDVRGAIVKSNRTDNASAYVATDKGVRSVLGS